MLIESGYNLFSCHNCTMGGKSITLSNNFKVICEELSKLCELEKRNWYRNEFLNALKTLNNVERAFIAKYFCKIQWNFGSASTLGILQELRILTATEYILSQTDAEHIQLVLNDFLESEFELIGNLYVNASYDLMNGMKLTHYLDESIRRLFSDLLQNPSLNNLSYLSSIKTFLPYEIRLKVITKHIIAALELHTSNVKKAFQNFTLWINEGVDDIKFTKDFYEMIISGNDEETLNFLFKCSTAGHFKEWKFYLILLQTIASRCPAETLKFIRKYLKTRMHQIASTKCKQSMFHLILTVRAANATTMDVHRNIDAYAEWYKQNIGDMKFVLSSTEFQNVIALLQECLAYEVDEDFLQVHISIAISPPVLCSKIVQTYKTKCKHRMSEIKGKVKQLSLDESIIISDSD